MKKIMAAILTGIGMQAGAEPITVTANDLRQYDLEAGQAGLHRRLFDLGLLVTTDKKGIFIWKDVEIADSDEASLCLIKDFVKWFTSNRVGWESKEWSEMTLASQDIKGPG